MDKFWILSWREFVLWKTLFVSAQSSPKRSSACLEMLLSCRIIPHNVFTDTASSSLFSPSSNFPRLSSIGSTDLFISGMVDYQINRHREIKAKIPVFFDLHRMVVSSCRNDQIQKCYRFTNFHPCSNTQNGDFLLPKILREWVAGLSVIFGRRPFSRKKADKLPIPTWPQIFSLLECIFLRKSKWFAKIDPNWNQTIYQVKQLPTRTYKNLYSIRIGG